MKSSEIFTLSKLNLKLELGVVAHTCKFQYLLGSGGRQVGKSRLENTKQNKARAGEIVQ